MAYDELATFALARVDAAAARHAGTAEKEVSTA
jgi:hypothetical protein